ncbi:MAG: His/Gly/Thr/Pro-type tRNA ligase C-terminal domain-containing protein [Candidatus Falkowbacteria bacterium]|nr:His/Gly/Thr/Pro-type tRNA ligase C-terminal domain-containing protein [Candidatus Falkowbacteria bacterium]
MRQSQLFTRTVKELPKDETSYNAQALIRAGFIDKVAAGVYSYLPLGKRVLDKICRLIRKEMDEIGGQEILMSALIPKENMEASGRWAAFDVLFRLNGGDNGDNKEYALGATHEEIVSPLAKKFIYSYKDLPFGVYQIQTKFRNEKRAKAGLLRGREFLMKDLYSFHTDQADLDAYYEKATAAYKKIYQRLGLGDITYLTYAAGGTFSKYSHEFQTVTPAGEDSIYICEKCSNKVAVNKEIIAEQNACPLCGNKKLTEKKAIEVGNIFKLGTKFSAPFHISYKDSAGQENTPVMGCYGMGPSRIMGAIVEIHHDDKGIIWPESIAPFKIHLLSLNENEAATRIYVELSLAGFEVLYDDRELSAGEKFADADLIGCPYRLVVSKKTLSADSVEIKRRSAAAGSLVKIKDLASKLK